MKYRSITLNDNENYNISFVKYTDEYKYELEKLKKLNRTMADSVERCPKIYSELSEEQSYMILCDNSNCIGGIDIGISFNERNLEIKLFLDNSYFNSEKEIIHAIEQIIESLRLFFYDKENIEIQLLNNIDLSKFNSSKYTKQIYNEHLTTYLCSNSKHNFLIPCLINEITKAGKNLVESNQTWKSQIDICEKDLDKEIDSKLIEEYNQGTISIDELFYKAKSLSWYDIKTDNTTRTITFYRNGDVKLSQTSVHFKGLNYVFKYNLLYKGFSFVKYPSISEEDKKILEIEKGNKIKIKYGNLEIIHNEKGEDKKITYVTNIIDKSSIYIEIWHSNNDEINRCYVDSRTHKSNNKINGKFQLTIYPGFYGIILYYVSRNGDFKQDFTQILPKELISSVGTEKLSYDMIWKIINETIILINKHITPKTKKPISETFIPFTVDISDIETKTLEAIKQIQEIPLPSLQENIEKFINEEELVQKDIKKRSLKK